jgi:hypothetical protein
MNGTTPKSTAPTIAGSLRNKRIFELKQDIAVARLRLLTNEDLEAIYDLSPATLQSYRAKKIIPPPLDLPGAVRWTQRSIRSAIDKLEEADREYGADTRGADKPVLRTVQQ